ncbi:MAG: methyltransferase domain-containing protein [Lachnospiraceae bacterium]|nr:methyltransferase domain-containing protein [Lachnospiraceae bacterium]
MTIPFISFIKKKRNEARLKRLRFGIKKEQLGLEIGPSLRPVASKKDGYNVEIIDHLGKEELVKKYREMGLDTSKIETVDYIWDGRSYSELTGKTDHYDYVIASHVIEHTPDLISFLRDCSSMLKTGGILSLAVPDKRYTLDHFRSVSTISEVIDRYVSHANLGTAGALTEYALHVCERNGRTAWSKEIDMILPHRFDFVHSSDLTKQLYKDMTDRPSYHDIHQFVFTPSSFRLLIAELRELELIDLDIYEFYNTVGSEFYISMKKSRSFTPLSPVMKQSLLKKASHENMIR